MEMDFWRNITGLQTNRSKYIFLWGMALGLIALLGSAYLAKATPLWQTAAEGQVIFAQLCKACHTIGGGRLVGPDLQDITQLRDEQWLRDFILAPDRMIAAGDPLSLQLLADYNNLPMPNLGLKAEEVDALLAYLADPGGSGEGQTEAVAVVAGGQAGRGEKIFSGAIPLENGGMSCLACHSVAGTGALGGGSLGPDLTHVYRRYGETGLAGALAGLPFPNMRGIFATRPLTQVEQADLLAFFAQVDQEPAAGVPNAWFWWIGGLGALALFAALGFFWPRQRVGLAEKLRAQHLRGRS
jgi:mono/diheme cytochrome c family protein